MMKIIQYLVIVGWLITASNAKAEDGDYAAIRSLFAESGLMHCEITSSYNVHVEDGKALVNRLADADKVGDTLNLIYYYDPLVEFVDWVLQFKLFGLDDEALVNIHVEKEWFREYYRSSGVFAFKAPDPTSNRISLSNNYISVAQYDKRLLLERYYKGDWHGTLTLFYSNLTSAIKTLDCRPIEDSISQIVDDMKINFKAK